MPDKIKNITYSTEVAIPFEVFQDYLKKISTQNTYLKWGFFFSLLLPIAIIAALISVPLLWPAAAVLFLIFGIVFGAIPSIILPIFTGIQLFSNRANIKFEAESIQASVQGAPRYTLSKVQKNNSEYTVFSTDKEPSVILFSSIQGEIITLLGNMIQNLTDEKTQLETRRENLTEKVQNNLGNVKSLKKSSIEMISIKKSITDCEAKLDLLRTALSEKYESKNTLLTEASEAIEKFKYSLNTQESELQMLKEIQESIRQFKKAQENFPDLSTVFSKKINTLEANLYAIQSRITACFDPIILKIKDIRQALYAQRIAPQTKDRDWIKMIIHQMDRDLDLILNSIFLTNGEIGLKYFEKEITQYYSNLLENRNTRAETLDLLNHILINHASPSDSVNQTIYYILANHFYRQSMIEQACQYALKLNSKNENNANLKEEIIRLYFETQGLSEYPKTLTDLLLTSHLHENAYQTMQALLSPHRVPQTSSLYFSNFSQTPPAPSDLPLSPLTDKNTPKK